MRGKYVATRGVEPPQAPDVPVAEFDHLEAVGGGDLRRFHADPVASGLRLDQYLTKALTEISRARVQMLIQDGQVRVSGAIAKPKQKLAGGELIEIDGDPKPPPLHATPEDIPLQILFEDPYLAVVNKPAGMMVHTGAGATEDSRSGGTLVNAVLFHLNKLSAVGGEQRPGIVHRLDKQTSGAIIIAKDDITHRKLGEMFAARTVHKTYLALVHGRVTKGNITVDLPIARDLVRRTRMTTRRADGRSARSHVTVMERLATRFGSFTLLEIRIETGRTHQIRVHLQALGHPVVGDTLYGAARTLGSLEEPRSLQRNFLHAAHLAFSHPRTGELIEVNAPVPEELSSLLDLLRGSALPEGTAAQSNHRPLRSARPSPVSPE